MLKPTGRPVVPTGSQTQRMVEGRRYNGGASELDPGAAGDTSKAKTCQEGKQGEVLVTARGVKIDAAPVAGDTLKYDGRSQRRRELRDCVGA